MLGIVMRQIHNLPTEKAAVIGGSGGGASVIMANLDQINALHTTIDLQAFTATLQQLTIVGGFLTMLGSAGLIVLKYLDRKRGKPGE